MSHTTNLAALVTFLAVIGIGAAVQAGNRRGSDSPLDRTEVLIGNYHCGADADGGFQWVDLSATGDIFAERTFLQDEAPPGGSPAERCDPITNLVNESLAAAACSLGSVRIRRDETGETRDFSFTCHAPRSKLISVIAELGHLILSP